MKPPAAGMWPCPVCARSVPRGIPCPFCATARIAAPCHGRAVDALLCDDERLTRAMRVPAVRGRAAPVVPSRIERGARFLFYLLILGLLVLIVGQVVGDVAWWIGSLL